MAGRLDTSGSRGAFRAALMLSLSALVAIAASSGARAEELPLWARRTSRALTPHWASGAPAVQLFDETRVKVREAGRVIVLRRGVVRVLRPGGLPESFGEACLPAEGGEVLSARAWRVGVRGEARALPVERDSSRAGTAGDAGAAGRGCVRVTPEAALAGTVFVWEIVTEDDLPLPRWTHDFSGPLPVVESRFAIILPDGFEPDAQLASGGGVYAVRTGRAWYGLALGLAATPVETPESAPMPAQPTLFVAWRAPEGSPPTWGPGRAAMEPHSVSSSERLRAVADGIAALMEPGRDPGLGHGWDMRPQRLAVVMSGGFGGESHSSSYDRNYAALFDRRAWLLAAASRRQAESR